MILSLTPPVFCELNLSFFFPSTTCKLYLSSIKLHFFVFPMRAHSLIGKEMQLASERYFNYIS